LDRTARLVTRELAGFAFSLLVSYRARTVVSKTSSPSARTEKLFSKLGKITCGTSSGASPEMVHDLRTTARRIETLLSTHRLDEHGATAKLARQLAKLRRRAGKLRDIDVHIAALEGVRLENGARDKSLVHDHLSKLRSKAEAKLSRTLDDEVSKGLVKRLKRAAQDLKDPAQGLPTNDHTQQALTKFKALVESSPQLTEKTLHDFRIDCKRIRYLAEMSGETRQAERVVSELKNIQDAIGEWHDWLTLTEVAKEVVPSATSGLVAALRAGTRSKFNEALRITSEAKRELLAMKVAELGPVSVSPRMAAIEGPNGNRRPPAGANSGGKPKIVAA
jgi:CHAD domain-containing protein